MINTPQNLATEAVHAYISSLTLGKLTALKWKFHKDDLIAAHALVTAGRHAAITLDEYIASLNYKQLNAYRLGASLLAAVVKRLGYHNQRHDLLYYLSRRFDFTYASGFEEMALDCEHSYRDAGQTKKHIRDNYFNSCYDDFFGVFIYDKNKIAALVDECAQAAAEQKTGRAEAIQSAREWLSRLRKEVIELAAETEASRGGEVCANLSFDAGGSSYLVVENQLTEERVQLRISDHRSISGTFPHPDFNISLQDFTSKDLRIGRFLKRSLKRRSGMHKGQKRVGYVDFADDYPHDADDIFYELGLPSLLGLDK